MSVVEAQIPYVDDAGIVVDARREPSWEAGWRVPGSFVQFQPSQGATPSGGTDVWVMADARALYLYAVVHDPEPWKIRASFGRRDTQQEDDSFGVYLDPTGEAQRAYLFTVNAAGVQGDGTRVSSATIDDGSWNGAWSSAARRTDDGYEIEIAVPWRSIRHPRESDRIGLLFVRHISRFGEKSSWPALDAEVSGLLVQEALLRGPGVLPSSAGLDLHLAVLEAELALAHLVLRYDLRVTEDPRARTRPWIALVPMPSPRLAVRRRPE